MRVVNTMLLINVNVFVVNPKFGYGFMYTLLDLYQMSLVKICNPFVARVFVWEQ